MREVKFRAWDKENRAMVYSDDNPHDDFVFIIENEGLQFYYLDTDRHLMDTNSIKMQYTGLKDKNGTEIYERDIIECLHEGNGFVTKRHGTYGIETRFGFYPFIEIFGELEVIGNIYENTDLLKKQ